MDIFIRTYTKDYRVKRCARIAARLNERNTRFDPGDAQDATLRCVRFRDFLVRNRRATSGGAWQGLAWKVLSQLPSFWAFRRPGQPPPAHKRPSSGQEPQQR